MEPTMQTNATIPPRPTNGQHGLAPATVAKSFPGKTLDAQPQTHER
jgi:hypothetical protein